MDQINYVEWQGGFMSIDRVQEAQRWPHRYTIEGRSGPVTVTSKNPIPSGENRETLLRFMERTYMAGMGLAQAGENWYNITFHEDGETCFLVTSWNEHESMQRGSSPQN